MKIIGRDVTVYSWQLAGVDIPGGYANGLVSSLLGRWETIEVNMEKDWADLTSADASQPEMRKTIQKWDASCKSQVNFGGSQAIEAFLNADFAIITFTDIVSNRQMICRGGIKKSGGTWGQENVKDTFDIHDVGREPFGGVPTLEYI